MRTLLLEFRPGFFPLIYYEILKFEREKSDSLMLSVENELWKTGKVNWDKKTKKFKFVFLHYAQRQLTFKSKFDYCFYCFLYYFFFLFLNSSTKCLKRLLSVGRKCTSYIAKSWFKHPAFWIQLFQLACWSYFSI